MALLFGDTVRNQKARHYQRARKKLAVTMGDFSQMRYTISAYLLAEKIFYQRDLNIGFISDQT